jgi:hypothetical protein
MDPEFDWQAEARAAANRIKARMFQAHRGAIPWRDLGVSVVFGNDGYTGLSGRVRREVVEVRKRIAAAGMTELGFATDEEEDYTWAMIVRTDDIAFLSNAVWEAWNLANGRDPKDVDAFRAAQEGIAAESIWDSTDEAPRSSLN